jgi:carboxyl-terminal processing protease
LPDIDLPSAVDPENVGESSRERALPWDQIKATGFLAEQPLDSEIAFLTQFQNTRMAGDPDIEFLISDIAAVDLARTQRSISLNRDERVAEREERQAARLTRENERRVAMGLEPVESFDDIDTENLPDILLDQATQIIADLASLNREKKSAALSRTSNSGS